MIPLNLLLSIGLAPRPKVLWEEHGKNRRFPRKVARASSFQRVGNFPKELKLRRNPKVVRTRIRDMRVLFRSHLRIYYQKGKRLYHIHPRHYKYPTRAAKLSAKLAGYGSVKEQITYQCSNMKREQWRKDIIARQQKLAEGKNK